MTVSFLVYAVAILSAFLVTMLSVPLWQKWCVRVGLVDEPGHRKIHDAPIPLAGGLSVMTGLLLPTVAAVLLLWLEGQAPTNHQNPGLAVARHNFILPPIDAKDVSLLGYGLSRRSLELAGILFGALAILALGCIDDKYELRPYSKFLGQILVAGLVAASGARITLFIPSPPFHYAITILWIVTVINAFNFMDNMNGLCTGLGTLGAWYFASLAALEGQYLVALIAFLTFGALLGFLPYNFPAARVFLGDSGSHLVGYLLAVMAILPHFYTAHHPRKWAVLVPLLVLAVPLLDMAWVVIFRTLNKRPFYVGDTNHLSHRLVRLGLSRAQSVLTIWLIAALVGAIVYLM
jgi:UDP-GlcNAc:undecaprenyl-phosphate GlcNAc-1-phosphate transferase